jgi:redox-sensitive bicupin YhaK (pirin superfamily)
MSRQRVYLVDMTTSSSAVSVLRREDQVRPPAVGGVLQANKPVVGGRLASGERSAALFYWSHSRFLGDFEFGLHRHEGFEIATFILEGENSHFDTATQQWVTLRAGDMQIIRSGSGVSHNERVAEGSRAFQIWFDPGYVAALELDPSYRDHPAASFTSRPVGGAVVTELIGGDGPVEARTEGLLVRRIRVAQGDQAQIDVGGADRFSLGYVIDGAPVVNGVAVGIDDAFRLDGDPTMDITATTSTDVFVVSLPAHPSYQPVLQR